MNYPGHVPPRPLPAPAPARSLPTASGVESIEPDAWDAKAPAPNGVTDRHDQRRLHDLLDGGYIERYHVKGQRMIMRQSVADHSWRLAAVVFHINPQASSNLILGCLFHDVSERVTGDIPSPVKNTNPEVQRVFNEISTAEEIRLGIRFSLTETEQRLLAWADRFEGALHCWDEVQMGNRLMLRTLLRYMDYCRDKRFKLEYGWMEDLRLELFNTLDQQVQQYLKE